MLANKHNSRSTCVFIYDLTIQYNKINFVRKAGGTSPSPAQAPFGATTEHSRISYRAACSGFSMFDDRAFLAVAMLVSHTMALCALKTVVTCA